MSYLPQDKNFLFLYFVGVNFRMVSTEKECSHSFSEKEIIVEETIYDDEAKSLYINETEEYHLFQRRDGLVAVALRPEEELLEKEFIEPQAEKEIMDAFAKLKKAQGANNIPAELFSGLRRSVGKSGHCALPRKPRSSYLSCLSILYRDPFSALVEIRWRNMILIYTLSFIVSWFLFGIFWWIIAYAHGDLADSPYVKPEIEPCITMMTDFISSFLFSLETQYTTGYGTRSPTTECPEAIFLLSFQSIFGVLLQSVMVGAVFAKLSRPKNRGHAIIFSKKAVISMRDGTLCFMFRLGDEKKSFVSDCKINAWLVQTKVTKEGELIPNYLTKFKVSADDAGNSIFLLWPVTVVHKIDSSSPLYELSPLVLKKSDIEIVVSLVCTAETTGQSTEIRYSYTPNDIIWGHRFSTILQSGSSGFVVDYSKFDETESLETPFCCPKQLESWMPKALSMKGANLKSNSEKDSIKV